MTQKRCVVAACFVLTLFTGCRGDTPDTDRTPPEAADVAALYSPGEPIDLEAPEIDGCYRGQITCETDVRTLIISVEGNDVRVWIDSTIYPTGATVVGENSLKAPLRLAGDEMMVLNGRYADDAIQGSVELSELRGHFEVQRLWM